MCTQVSGCPIILCSAFTTLNNQKVKCFILMALLLLLNTICSMCVRCFLHNPITNQHCKQVQTIRPKNLFLWIYTSHGIMGRRFPDGGLLRYRKWVPQQLGYVNKQWSGDSRPMGARHGDTAANHTDLQSGCGRTCVFAVRVWSNLWELIWLRTSHYSMNELLL